MDFILFHYSDTQLHYSVWAVARCIQKKPFQYSRLIYIRDRESLISN